ncbi:MAG TPA: outer membrane protein transport protein, partial [Kofleriaceae bacterium]
ASADLMQLLVDDQDLVPISHLAGRLLAPDKPYLSTQLALLQKLVAADDQAVLTRIAGNLFSGYDDADPGVPSVAAIVDGSGEVNRTTPGATRPDWTAGDVAVVLGPHRGVPARPAARHAAVHRHRPGPQPVRRPMRRPIIATALLASLAPVAHAGGMVLPVRGVRELERAGALVAGAEDADALWVNPAGLAHLAGDGLHALLFDAAFVKQSVDYARTDSGGNPQPRVANQSRGIPVPTVAGALGIGDRLVLAGGIAAPYAGLHKYDAAGPQRYGSVSLDGSLFVYLTAGAAYKLGDKLRIGAQVTDVYSKIISQVVLSGCPGQTVCAPEDPEFDAFAQDTQSDYWSPSGMLGVQYDALDNLTLGLSAQTPSKVSADGELKSRLPSSAFFQGAKVVGDSSTLELTLPAVIRGGVELRPIPELRIEAAIDIELWSEHKDITITPHDIEIQNAAGVGTYVVGNLEIARHYKSSYAPSLGVEWHAHDLMLGAGYSYETAAAPKGYVSVLTVDSAK